MNKMQEVRIEKVVLSIGGTEEQLERGFKLLKMISEMSPMKVKAKNLF